MLCCLCNCSKQQNIYNVIVYGRTCKENLFRPGIEFLQCDKIILEIKRQRCNTENDQRKKQETQQIYLKPTPIKNYFPIYSNGKNHIWQLDLMDVQNMSDNNEGIKDFLICIVVFTRYLYIEPMKDKTKETVVKHWKKILKDEKPEVLEMDFGSEFVSLPVKKTFER